MDALPSSHHTTLCQTTVDSCWQYNRRTYSSLSRRSFFHLKLALKTQLPNDDNETNDKGFDVLEMVPY